MRNRDTEADWAEEESGVADDKLPDTDEPLDLSGVEQIPASDIDMDSGDLVLDADFLVEGDADGTAADDAAASCGCAASDDVPCAEENADGADGEEPEEVLPFEFLQDPEAYSTVLPRYGLDRSRAGGGLRETVIMSPSEVRRLEARSAGARPLSTRSSSAGSAGGSRRSKRVDEAELSPEELAHRRRNDRIAKFVLYFAVVLVSLIFVALLTYKAPFYLPDYFPNGIWPWSVIFPEKYGG